MLAAHPRQAEHGVQDAWNVAEVLWETAEGDRRRAAAALAHAEGVQRICDKVLLGEPLPVAGPEEFRWLAGSVGRAVDRGLLSVIAVLGPQGSGKRAVAQTLLQKTGMGAGAVVHFDGPEAGPLTFADSGVTLVLRSRDTIFHSGVSLAVCFTGPWSPSLARAYAVHLPQVGHRRLRLLLELAAHGSGVALLVCDGRVFALHYEDSPACTGAGI